MDREREYALYQKEFYILSVCKRDVGMRVG